MSTRCPRGFTGLSVGFMFYAELIAPFFVFGPRPIRLVGFASLVLLQFLIAATGNYGFFNLLAVVICLSILDDRDWEWLIEPVRRATAAGKSRDTVDQGPSGAGESVVMAAAAGRRCRGRDHPAVTAHADSSRPLRRSS